MQIDPTETRQHIAHTGGLLGKFSVLGEQNGLDKALVKPVREWRQRSHGSFV